MLADLSARAREDARMLVLYSAVVEGSLADRNERQAIKALRTVLHRAKLLEALLPKEEGEGESDAT